VRPSRAGVASAADHTHDLDPVAFLEHDGSEFRVLDDLTVVLHRHRAGIDPELFEIEDEGNRGLELDLLAVDLERDHSNILMAA
jgi:hypothetical protein